MKKNKKAIQTMLVAVSVLILLVVTWMFIQPKSVRDLPEIIEEGRLTIITDSSSMGFSVLGDSVVGFQYEIAKAFANSLGVELVVEQENNLDDAIQELFKANCDIVANFMPVTIQYKENILFSLPFKRTRQVLVQRVDPSDKNRLVKRQMDLAEDTIYIPSQSPNKMRLLHLSDEIADTIYLIEIPQSSKEELVAMVASGKIKQTICDEQLAQRLKLEYSNIDVSLPLSLPQEYSWAVHIESPLLHEKLNLFLTDFIGSTEYWKLYRRYY